jgi:Na+/H+-dicarboxylate symporter
MVLATAGIPAAGVGLIIGVDRILDMSRTAVNVTGDLVAALVLDRHASGHRTSSEQLADEAERDRQRAESHADVVVSSGV